MKLKGQTLREVHRITERKDGCVWKTEYVEDRWVDIENIPGRPDDNPDLMWVTKSTSYEGKTLRSIIVED